MDKSFSLDNYIVLLRIGKVWKKVEFLENGYGFPWEWVNSADLQRNRFSLFGNNALHANADKLILEYSKIKSDQQALIMYSQQLLCLKSSS